MWNNRLIVLRWLAFFHTTVYDLFVWATEQLVLDDTELTDAPDYHYLSRPEKYAEAVRKASHVVRKITGKEMKEGRAHSYFYGK
jgi:Acyl-coenzyme A oxidase N-terminal